MRRHQGLVNFSCARPYSMQRAAEQAVQFDGTRAAIQVEVVKAGPDMVDHQGGSDEGATSETTLG